MKKQVQLLLLCVLLSHLGLHAQTVYLETGFNTQGEIDYTYTHTVDIEVKPEKSSLPQSHFEIGLRHNISDKGVVYFGFSDNDYTFTNNHYYDHGDSLLHVKHFFECSYLGANLGVDYSLMENDVWNVFVGSKLSRNLLSKGIRTDEVISHDASILGESGANLMLHSDYEKSWLTIQFGLALERKVSDLASIYARYSFTESLTGIEHEQESYDFNFHSFSVGLTLDIGAYGNGVNDNEQ